MKILVGIKRVMDFTVRVQVKKDGSGVETGGVKMAINPFDEIALEEALRIREKGVQAEVVAVSIGPADVQPQLRTALAMGADRAILVESADTIQPLMAARIFHELAKRENADLVILGKQAIDDDCNQTGQMLAALWDRPQATFASAVELKDKTLRCHPRSGCGPGSDRSGPAGRGDHGPAAQYAALREDAGHHESAKANLWQP